jgi:hypothetical protein
VRPGDADRRHHHDDLHMSAGDGSLLRWCRLQRGRDVGLPAAPGALSVGHELHDDGGDVRLYRRVDPVWRPQAERSDLQLLQVGHLPAGDDVRWRSEERRVRLRLRLPLNDT